MNDGKGKIKALFKKEYLMHLVLSYDKKASFDFHFW